ncbi:MAG TPA: hypothetical protein PLA94_01180 [Myxococcota bacterium]|nr:hypothetical protein [Myxococcota bacterium]
MSKSPLLLILLMAACDGSKPTEEEKQAQPDPAVMTPAAPPTKLSAEELAAAAQNVGLVPSPVETQKALEKAGISSGISKLVPERPFKLNVDNKDVVAVRTGVVLADALLTVKDAPKEKLIERMNLVKTGMAAVGAGADIQRTLDDLIARIQNDGVTRDNLIKELDELQGAVVPEIKYEAGDQVLPLIQAGSWLAGSNLVATAILASSKPEAGSVLLRQPQVVEYFQRYVKVEGTTRAPSDVLTQLDSSLATLLEIAKKRAITIDDITVVKSTTDSVLSLL